MTTNIMKSNIHKTPFTTTFEIKCKVPIFPAQRK